MLPSGRHHESRADIAVQVTGPTGQGCRPATSHLIGLGTGFQGHLHGQRFAILLGLPGHQRPEGNQRVMVEALLPVNRCQHALDAIAGAVVVGLVSGRDIDVCLQFVGQEDHLLAALRART